MALANLDDINVHLPDDKLQVVDAIDPAFERDAERIIKGYLSGVYTPVILASWSDPDSTPGLIRAIAGRLIAAFYYRQRYSEDSLDDPQYAQLKYNEAMSLIAELRAGTISLEEIPTDSGTNLMYWPDETTFGPVFTMDMER